MDCALVTGYGLRDVKQEQIENVDSIYRFKLKEKTVGQ